MARSTMAKEVDSGRSLTLALLLAGLVVLTGLSLLSAHDSLLGLRAPSGIAPNLAGEFGIVWAGFWTSWLGRSVVWCLLPLGLFWSLRLATGFLRSRLSRASVPYVLLLVTTCVAGALLLGVGDPFRWGRLGVHGARILTVFGPAGAPVVAVTLWLVLLGITLRLALPDAFRSFVARQSILGVSRAVDVLAVGASKLGSAVAGEVWSLWDSFSSRRERSREKSRSGAPRTIRGLDLLKQEPKEPTPASEPPRIIVPRPDERRDEGHELELEEIVEPTQIRRPTGPFPLPSLELLTDPPSHETRAVDRQEILEKSRLLEKALADFGIQGEVGEVHPGPVITRYEYTPGSGVRIAQITSRADDIALALRASRVRLLAPIPGKAAVGIEVPNARPARIYIKEALSTEQFLNSRDPLLITMGKDIAGHPFFASLERMPHLLVAGTTGSGKSMFLHTIMLSILLRRTPEEVRFLLIDPKRLEFTPYEGIPHLLAPVVTEAKEAAKFLQWLLREMDRRYLIFARLGVRNLEAYNSLPEDPESEPREPLPMLLVVVDELADLILTGSTEIETSITRLAQMARAVGIHLVLATQRPSVDVLTGLIKANFPARIAFQVATRTDSRTILDANGAESLLGLGDMLYIPPGKAQAHRLHAPFIPDGDREAVIRYLQEAGEEYSGAMALSLDEESLAQGLMDAADDDPLIDEAIRIVVLHQQGSTSLLQRKLRVGYTRAGRLMDILERRGIVGPFEGSKARAVLVDRDSLETHVSGDG